ncbi:MAG: methyltransferase [Planctomycetes bacterium]|nr:methyltransferase [Planctomycetota bacterium]
MQNKRALIPIFLCIAAIGCYATIAQVMLIREFLNIFYGNELCLGIVFGAWFLGIATGAFAGAKIEYTFKHAFTVFVITLMAMCFVLPVQIVFVRGVRGLLSVGVGEYISILPLLLTSIGLILPFSFIVGFIFPFSSKIISGATRDAAVDIGVVYIIESMGSLFGGIVFSFFLVSRFHSFKIITLLNTGLFILLTFLLFNFHRKGQVYSSGEEDKKTKMVLGFISLGLASVMIVVWLSPIPDRVEVFSSKMRWKTLNPHIELMTSADSKYQHIDIGRQAEQYSIYLNGQYASAFPNEYEYAQIAHLVMTQHPSPKHVLLIGSGLGGLISEMIRHPIESLDYVEIDQRLLQISDKYLSSSDRQALSDRRVTIIHQDGRYYVKNSLKRQYYDIILVNTPDPSTAFLNRFYTLEFFREAQKILKSDGVLIASVSSAVTYIGKEVGSYTGSLYRTLHETFRNVLVTPGQTNSYFACNKDGVITLNIETLMERYRKSQVKSDYFTEYLFYTLLQPEQVKFIENQLSQRKDLLVNTDARPVTYFLNLVLWDSLAGGRSHGLFHGLKDVKLQWFLIPIVIALAGRIIYVKFKINQPESVEEFNPYYTKQLKTNCLIALATTGFTGIALEIVLLYAFQNIYGYIYERVGVIVAVFMVGLAVGGYFMNQIIKKTRNRSTERSRRSPKSEIPNHCLPPTDVDSYLWINLLMVFEGVVVLFAIILPFIIYVLSFYSVAAEVGLTCFIGIAGVLTGLVFPLVNKIFMQSSKDMAVSAGITYSADHIGAILGAIFTGVILVPLLGVFGMCLILSALKISSLVLIAFSVLCRKRPNYRCKGTSSLA